MKKSLLATVAAVSLIAGAGFASAEGMKDQPKAGAEMNNGAETKGGTEMKAEPKADMKADSKSDISGDTKANADKAKPSTTGQSSEPRSGAAGKSSTEEKAAPGTRSNTTTEKSGATERSGTTERPASGSSAQGTQSPGRSSAQGTQSTSTTSASVNLTPEQKSKIRTTVLQSSSAPKISRSQINFSLNIGSPVPRNVHFVEVPPTLVEIHPQWRGYRYFVVDDEIVIVDPRTLKIVAVLEV